jgi:hypothetical protein
MARLQLRPGESLCWKAGAGRVRRAGTAGGLLVLTESRLFFQPNRIDSALGRRVWECPSGAVTAVEALERQPKAWFAGGMRRRLLIRTHDGVEAFVVNGLEGKMAELRDLLRLAV